eukprot:5213921-Karenia_brevis.AAC.1
MSSSLLELIAFVDDGDNNTAWHQMCVEALMRAECATTKKLAHLEMSSLPANLSGGKVAVIRMAADLALAMFKKSNVVETDVSCMGSSASGLGLSESKMISCFQQALYPDRPAATVHIDVRSKLDT